MTKRLLLLAAALAGSSTAALAARAPAPAPAAAASAGGGVNGIAVADLQAVVENSNAARTAQTQRATTYKAQFDQAEARRNQITTQLQPLADKFNKDRAANVPPATLQQEYGQINQLQESGKAELQKILEPVALSEAYVNEQISDKLPGAVQAAMTKNNVTLLLNPQGVLVAGPVYGLNQQILAELNAAIPSASIVPPAGWLPREMRQQQQQQQAAPGQRGAAPDGR